MYKRHLYSLWSLDLGACIFKSPRKAQSALIDQLSQAWAGTAHLVLTSAVFQHQGVMSDVTLRV